MPFNESVFVGVDPSGGRKPFTYAAIDLHGSLLALSDGSLDEMLAYLASFAQVIVAVNAPPRPNMGLVREAHQALITGHFPGRSVDMRVAESELRSKGIQVSRTPSERTLCSEWMQLGFDFYAKLSKHGFKAFPAESASRLWVETHPQACFAAMLSQLPMPRLTLEGRLQRQLVLFEAGLNVRDPMEYFEEITRHRLLQGTLPVEQIYAPNELDALAAAYLAFMAAIHPQKISSVGHKKEGLLFVPVAELKTRYI